MNPEIIGWAGSIVNAIVLFPQAYDAIKTKKLRDISETTSILNFINSILWLVYGYFIQSWPLVVTNFIQLILSGLILFMKLKYKKNN